MPGYRKISSYVKKTWSATALNTSQLITKDNKEKFYFKQVYTCCTVSVVLPTGTLNHAGANQK